MELRASDADRESTVQRLHTAALEGRLDADELEERIEAAYAARHCAELTRLTADVTPPPAPVPAAAPPVFVRRQASTNGFAIASLVCSLGWFMGGSVLAVVFGHIALNQINRTGGHQGSRGLAVTGLVLGYGAIAFVVLTMLLALGYG